MSGKTPNFYPRVDNQAIHQVIKLVKVNPTYLEDPDCPYSPEVKELFMLLTRPAEIREVIIEKRVEVPIKSVDDLEPENILAISEEEFLGEINRVWQQLKNVGANIGVAGDETESSEKNTYFRLATSSLQKFSDMRDAAINRMNVTKFTECVLGAMEDILDPDQRNLFMERLKKLEE